VVKGRSLGKTTTHVSARHGTRVHKRGRGNQSEAHLDLCCCPQRFPHDNAMGRRAVPFTATSQTRSAGSPVARNSVRRAALRATGTPPRNDPD